MTQEQFHDLQVLGIKINEYCRAMENYRAIKEGREMLAKGLRKEYPNMATQAIRDRLWQQEEYLARTAQTAFDEMRMNACSLGWDFDYKDVHEELSGIMRKELVLLKDINV